MAVNWEPVGASRKLLGMRSNPVFRHCGVKGKDSQCGKLFVWGVWEFLGSAGSARQVSDLGAVIYNNI